MNLDKSTRQKLYKAKGRPITIEWPSDAPDPHGGKRYAVYSEEDGSRLFSIRLEESHRVRYGTKAKVRIDDDPTRILPGLAGVRLDDGSYETEPQRIDEDTEAEYAAIASLSNVTISAEQRQREKLKGKESRMGSSPRAERAVRRHQRAVERRLEAA